MKSFLALILILGLFAGCATIPRPVVPLEARPDPERLTAYEFTGRIAVNHEEKGNYGNIRWAKRGSETDVVLVSPFGQVVAEIHSEMDGVKLTLADKREYRAENGEMLTQRVLGYSVPVDGLNYWLLGCVAKGVVGKQSLRPDGLLDRLEQDGWVIQYTDYVAVNGLELPRRLVLNRGELEIRLVIDHWSIDNQAFGNGRNVQVGD